MLFLAGKANRILAGKIAGEMGVELGQCSIDSFPDGELRVLVEEDLIGRDVFILQSTGPPVADNLFELLLLGDACRRNGAARLTALVPYFGYARQDRKTQYGEALGARLAADLLAVRFDRLVTVDLHNPEIEGFFSIPVFSLSATTLLAAALRPDVSAASHVLVAPDQGAVDIVRSYAALLKLPAAVVHKERLSGREVAVRGISGEVKDRSPVIVDDMISTGGTIIAAVEALLNEGCRTPVTIAVSHGLFVGEALERLASLPIGRFLVSNSLSLASPATSFPPEIIDISGLLANCIKRLVQAKS
jgi:ribose-phosphate pyrophosphokinase